MCKQRSQSPGYHTCMLHECIAARNPTYLRSYQSIYFETFPPSSPPRSHRPPRTTNARHEVGVGVHHLSSLIVQYISELLHLSPDIAGVTLLAFASGAPDIFTELAAIDGGARAGPCTLHPYVTYKPCVCYFGWPKRRGQ